MNSIILKIQKNTFLVLLPIVVFFTFSWAYLIRSVIIVILNPQQSIQNLKNTRVIIPQENKEPTKPVTIYEDTILGNMIRGLPIVIDNSPEAIAANGGVIGKDGKVIASSSAPVLTETAPGSDDLLVTGTVAGNPRYARVAIKAKEKDESEEYKLGEKVKGLKIKEIDQHHVVFFVNGVNLKVEIGETIGEAKKRQVAPVTAQNSDTLNTTGAPVYKKILSRTDIDKVLKDQTVIYKDARFGPNIGQNGKMDGYKIYQVGANHIFAQLGAKSGDIIKRVNGMPLTDTEKMFELWGSIKNAPKIVVDIDRAGKIETYEFTVRN